MKKRGFKAFIYRYTGIYLATREELDYIQSDEFWIKFREFGGHKKKGLGSIETQGLLVGLWQAQNGYARPWSNLGRFRRPKWFWKPINWVATFFVVLKWDFYGIVWSENPWKYKDEEEKS